ncbi:J domain-containing protein, partial [Candidatus Micrarchaeota archaeon]|nr:J domain-containing protein [Candidatus Micrarchaeota archaeon]
LATSEIQQAIKIDPELKDELHAFIGLAWVDRAKELMSNGQLEDSKYAIKQAVRFCPELEEELHRLYGQARNKKAQRLGEEHAEKARTNISKGYYAVEHEISKALKYLPELKDELYSELIQGLCSKVRGLITTKSFASAKLTIKTAFSYVEKLDEPVRTKLRALVETVNEELSKAEKIKTNKLLKIEVNVWILEKAGFDVDLVKRIVGSSTFRAVFGHINCKDPEKLKLEHRRLSKMFSPDLHGKGDKQLIHELTEISKIIHNAYEELTKPKK